MVSLPMISDRIHVARRYVRAVDLLRDHLDPGALDGYVLTPSARDAAIRLTSGLGPASSQRAFRVVGPYGSGKSSFGVFLSQLVSTGPGSEARRLLAEGAAQAADAVTHWHPAVISGRRVGFAGELLATIGRIAAEIGGATLAPADAAAALLARDRIDAGAVADVMLLTARAVREETGAGLLLLIDEMGRFLEHAAANVTTEDPAIFQLLAERAGGKPGGDLGVVTFMHHRFADYVSTMGNWIQDEWTRSAERYEELPFGESTEQTLFLLARAIEPDPKHTPAVSRAAAALYGRAVSRGVFATDAVQVAAIASRLYPLHPAAVATLSAAMRRFGQNERSIFGFLQSLEPAGLQRFAHETPYAADRWYGLAEAFDHICATSGSRPSGDRARRWSLAMDALTSAADMADDDRGVLKAIGLLAILEPVPGLVADVDTLAWSLGRTDASVQASIDALTARNLVYRRPHRGDHSLWSRSSVDLGDWLDRARRGIRPPARLHEVAHLLPAPRPLVAHRHYHETGTLRTFDVALHDGTTPKARQADGLILVVPIHPDEGAAPVEQALAAVAGDPVALVCARDVTAESLKWAHELAIWRWIRDNCEELRVDELARAEVSERIASAEAALIRAIAPFSDATDASALWWRDGERIDMPPGGLSVLLSQVCDHAFRQAPVLRNELINRMKLSTAIASARTRLLDRMLSAEGEPFLGLDGAPPERTIYLSLFQDSGLHRRGTDGGAYAFAEPSADDPRGWRPTWDAITRELGAGRPVSFQELIAELAKPPIGLRAGPALLVIAAFMLAARDRVALMERNTFQPDPSPAHFMRLGKSPANFALRYLDDAAGSDGVLEALATGLPALGSPVAPTVAALAERLYRWWNALPQHALDTREVPATAQTVRTALRKATEPAQLLLEDLPQACGATADGRIDANLYAERLDEAIAAIDGATPLVRRRAAAATAEAFGTRDTDALRSQIQADYGPHRLDLTEPRLRAFVDRASAPDLERDRWLDGIAGLLTGKRPDAWADTTIDEYCYEVRVIAGRLARWLALARTRKAVSAELYSVHVVGVDGSEDVVVVRRDRPSAALADRLERVRTALGNDPAAAEILAQLMAEQSTGKKSKELAGSKP
ncbi:hypothetical protein ACVWZA_000542 [Sphingomonas sp. UYAg733]